MTNLKDYEDIDEVTGIKRNNICYCEKMLQDPNSVSDDAKAILADGLSSWISKIVFDLLTLQSLLIRYDDIYKYRCKEKYMLVQKIRDIHNKLDSEYYDWKNGLGDWRYLSLFTDKEHSSFKYYFDYVFKDEYDIEYMLGEDSGQKFLKDHHLLGEIVY